MMEMDQQYLEAPATGRGDEDLAGPAGHTGKPESTEAMVAGVDTMDDG